MGGIDGALNAGSSKPSLSASSSVFFRSSAPWPIIAIEPFDNVFFIPGTSFCFCASKKALKVVVAGCIDSLITFFDVLNDSVFIDHEGRPVTESLVFIEDSIISHYRAFEITEQRKRYGVLFGELAVRGDAVNANAENLGVRGFEFGNISLICLHFLRSTTRKSQDIKGQHHVLITLEVAKFIGLAVGAPERKVWRCLADLQVRVRRLRGRFRRRGSLRRGRLRRSDRNGDEHKNKAEHSLGHGISSYSGLGSMVAIILMWRAHLPRVFTRTTPVPLFQTASLPGSTPEFTTTLFG